MSRRSIGQEAFGFAIGQSRSSSLNELLTLIDWVPIDDALKVISCAAKGEAGWPPLTLFKAMLLSIWYDLSDVKLSEALDERASFRRFCGFAWNFGCYPPLATLPKSSLVDDVSAMRSAIRALWRELYFLQHSLRFSLRIENCRKRASCFLSAYASFCIHTTV